MSAATSTTKTKTGSQKSFLVTAMLSLFLGVFGVDRFYLNKVGTGILKLITFGGFGIWYLIDLIIIYTGNAKDKNGDELAGREKDLKSALIVLGIFFAIGIISSASSSPSTTTTVVKTNTPTQPTEAEKAAAQAAAKTAAEKKAAEEAAAKAPKTSFGDGTYLVNTDIVPGTYKTEGTSYCYWERMSNTSGSFDAIIANENPRGQAVVTIAPSDAAFKTVRCGTWVKQ